ncbi:MAG: FIG00463476: hypothetical protein [uncultured Paraburkholderia sp.]|nr:MAG: FIG00463476: hypothetical protein [uncultured Paraburkholderia sp.]
MSIRLKLGLTLATLAFAGAALAQTPAAKPSRIRGDIVSLDGDVLKVHRRSGDTVSIELKPAVTVSAVKSMQLSDIKPGSFVGTAATTGTDGKLTATEVVVFPEAARGRYRQAPRRRRAARRSRRSPCTARWLRRW